MLRYLIVIVFFGASLAMAQQPQLSDEQKQRLIQGFGEMQACLAEVDQQALQRLGERGKALEAEIDGLCKAGDRGKAQSRALEFSREIRDDKDVKGIKKCGEQVIALMPEIPYMKDLDQDSEDSTHVCDLPFK